MAIAVMIACTAPSNDRPSSSVAGDYERVHKVFVFHGNEPVEVEVTDRFEVEAMVEDGSARVQGRWTTLSGATCELTGAAGKWVGNGYRVQVTTPTGDCHFHVNAAAGGLMLFEFSEFCGALLCEAEGPVEPFVLRRVESDYILSADGE